MVQPSSQENGMANFQSSRENRDDLRSGADRWNPKI